MKVEESIKEIFASAMEFTGSVERRAYLDHVCAGNEISLRTPEQTELRQGDSDTSFARIGGWLLITMVLVLTGCTTYRTEPPLTTSAVPLLTTPQLPLNSESNERRTVI